MSDAYLDPPRSMTTYAVRGPLVRWLREQAKDAHSALGPYRVLDVGCGVKPYEPLFGPYARSYVGVDPVDNPRAELRGSVEALPVEDRSFDVVLCNQVLEHCDDPAQAVRELRRVTVPGGRVLASTHGVMPYHPSPTDYWRWTRRPREALPRERCLGVGYRDARFRHHRLHRDDHLDQPQPHRSPFSTWALERPVDCRAQRRCGDDRRTLPAAPHSRPRTLFANFHVVAEVTR